MINLLGGMVIGFVIKHLWTELLYPRSAVYVDAIAEQVKEAKRKLLGNGQEEIKVEIPKKRGKVK
jgi:hypothetical protein